MTVTLPAAERSQQENLADRQNNLGEVLARAGFEGLAPEARLELIERTTLADYKAAADVVHRKVAPEHSHGIHPEVVKIVNPTTGEISHYTAEPAMRDGILERALENAQLVATNTGKREAA